MYKLIDELRWVLHNSDQDTVGTVFKVLQDYDDRSPEEQAAGFEDRCQRFWAAVAARKAGNNPQT